MTHLRATSVPPGYCDRGKPVLTEQGLVALLCLVLLCTGDGETGQQKQGGYLKGYKGHPHSLSGKYVSIKKLTLFSNPLFLFAVSEFSTNQCRLQ